MLIFSFCIFVKTKKKTNYKRKINTFTIIVSVRQFWL